MHEQALPSRRADSGNGVELAGAVAHLAALAVIGDGKAVRFVADLLDHMQHGRAAVEYDGLILLSVDVDDLFALGDGGERLRRKPQLFKSGGSGVQLPEAAVDEDERGQRGVLTCRYGAVR